MTASDSKSDTFLGTVKLTEATIPSGYIPGISCCIDSSVKYAAISGEKRLWLVNVPPGISPEQFENAKFKKKKVTTSDGIKLKVAVKSEPIELPILMVDDYASKAVSVELAGQVDVKNIIDLPELILEPRGETQFESTQDACQRFVPFGAAEPIVYSKRRKPEAGSSSPKKKSRRK